MINGKNHAINNFFPPHNFFIFILYLCMQNTESCQMKYSRQIWQPFSGTREPPSPFPSIASTWGCGEGGPDSRLPAPVIVCEGGDRTGKVLFEAFLLPFPSFSGKGVNDSGLGASGDVLGRWGALWEGCVIGICSSYRSLFLEVGENKRIKE